MRGLATVGVSGVGFIAASGVAHLSDDFAVACSRSSWASGDFPISTSSTAQILASSPTQLPYASTSIEDRSYRSVGCGIRFRYVGTELNRGGRVLYCQNPQLDNVFDGQNINDLANRQDAVIVPCTRKWTNISWTPSFYGMNEYQPGGTPQSLFGSGAWQWQFASIGIVLEGTPGNSFEYEFVQFFEWLPGKGTVGAVPSVTPSHSDPVGYGVVRDYLNNVQQYFGPETFNRFLNWTGAAGVSYLSHVVSGGGASKPTIEW